MFLSFLTKFLWKKKIQKNVSVSTSLSQFIPFPFLRHVPYQYNSKMRFVLFCNSTWEIFSGPNFTCRILALSNSYGFWKILEKIIRKVFWAIFHKFCTFIQFLDVFWKTPNLSSGWYAILFSPSFLKTSENWQKSPKFIKQSALKGPILMLQEYFGLILFKIRRHPETNSFWNLLKTKPNSCKYNIIFTWKMFYSRLLLSRSSRIRT